MPSAEPILYLLASALPLMASPGPANVSLAAAGSTFGLSRSLAFLAGSATGTVTVLCLVATGVTGMILALPVLAGFLSVLGIGYLVYLALRIATAPPLTTAGPSARPFSAVDGFVIALANPKAFAAFGAVFAGAGLQGGDPLVDAVVTIFVLAVAVVVVATTWLVVGAGLSGLFRRPATARAINILFAVTLLASVAVAIQRLLTVE